MKIRYLGVYIILTTSLFILNGCGHLTPGVVDKSMGTGDSLSLNIVTTFPPLYAHVSNIIDDNDTLINLVPPGTSIHTRQPKPSDLLAMESADVIVTNGLGLEEFLDGYLDNLERKGVIVVDTSKGVSTLDFEEHEEEHDEEHYEEHNEEHNGHDHVGHHHEGTDPHIRLDIQNVKIQVGNIVSAMSNADFSQKLFYEEQSDIYMAKLDTLDTNITDLIDVQTTPPFVVFHDAYQYFLQAYNLTDKQLGLVQEFHGDNPSQKEIAVLIKTIQDEGVATIFTEPQFNPSIVARLEQETGVVSKEIDPIGDELQKNGYINMMRELANSFSNQ